MKQVLQMLSTGETTLAEVPVPMIKRGHVLVEARCSLISAGTERMLLEFGKASYLEKARQQPDKVKAVIDKARTDGILATVDAVRSKLAQPIALGYCHVGVIRAVGEGVTGFQVGDRVASNGSHAEFVVVPTNLCARIPDGVSDEEAAFTVVASIGLQGLRLAAPTLGEVFVVIGAGLIGLLTIQLLGAHGCRVLAVDLDESKLALARRFGAETCNPSAGEDPVAFAMAASRGRGVDGVIIAASTKSTDPVAQAARMSRKRGRIVLVGVAGLELDRSEFYEKELTFQVSCSYGPGRYDQAYEEKGQDYPIGFVRWTEQRNFEAVLDMLAGGRLGVEPMISHRFEFDDAPSAYQVLAEDRSSLGILLRYAGRGAPEASRQVRLSRQPEFQPGRPVVGFIGAGNYASRILIPAFKEAGAQLGPIVTAGGVSAVVHGGKAGFAKASTDPGAILDDPVVNTVAIVTRHNTHAGFVLDALRAGKNVFVEKPLAIRREEVDRIEEAYDAARKTGREPHLMVGFNRRFAPQVRKIRDLLQAVREPKVFVVTVNAGHIPAEHWTQNPVAGGGRIIGEACHFIDLMRFLAGSSIVSLEARRLGGDSGAALLEDKAVITLGFADGSLGTVHYLANGAASFPKERVEVFAGGRVLQLDNFRKLTGYGWPGFRKMNLWRQDKGQGACAMAFLDAVAKGEPTPIPVEEIFEVARVTIEAADLLRRQ